MKNIFVLSKKSFDTIMISHGINNDNVINKIDVAFISINDTGGTNEVSYFKDCISNNVLELYFDDVEKDLEIPIIGENIMKKVKAFTIEQAKTLISFIENNKDKKIFIVHCSAGISRSGAVGTFINDYFKQSFIDFKNKNSCIHPNGHVLRLLNNEYNKL